MPQNLIKDLKNRAAKALEHLKGTYAGVRTGRAHPALVEDIKVDYFGTQMTVKQLGTVNIPESRQIVITVWDKAPLKRSKKPFKPPR